MGPGRFASLRGENLPTIPPWKQVTAMTRILETRTRFRANHAAALALLAGPLASATTTTAPAQPAPYVTPSAVSGQQVAFARAGAAPAGPSLAEALGAAAPSQTTVVSIADAKRPENETKEVVLRGKIAEYRAPTSDRAPHSLYLEDPTGRVRVACWRDTWDQIAERSAYGKPGETVTLRVKMNLFRGELEGHLLSHRDIKKGDEMPAADAPLVWQTDPMEGMKAAAAAGRRVMVFFDTPAAESSRFLSEKVFTDRRIREAVAQGYVPVRVGMDTPDQAKLANTLGVFRGGTVVLYDGTTGRALKNLTSIRTPEDLVRELK